MDKKDIAKVRNYMFLHDMKQKDMAKELGISHGYMRRILAGLDNSPRVEKLLLERIGEEQ